MRIHSYHRYLRRQELREQRARKIMFLTMPLWPFTPVMFALWLSVEMFKVLFLGEV